MRVLLLGRFSVFAGLLVLCGCTCTDNWWSNGHKVGPDYCLEDAPVAADWIDAGDQRVRKETESLAHWWAVFKDPWLDTLVQSANDQNLTLRVAGLRILEARAARAIAVGNLFPQSQQAFADYSHAELSENIKNQASADKHFSIWDSGFNLSWELDFWGRFRRAIEAADADLDATVETYDDVLVTLVSDVASTYIEIRTLQSRLAIVRDNVSKQRDTLVRAEARLNAGRQGAEIDVPQQRSLVEQTESLIPALEIALRQANNRLCILLGEPPRNLIAELGDAPIPAVPGSVAVGIPGDLLRRRPDVRRAERDLAAQSARIGIATAELYPHIAINGSIGLEGNQFNDLFDSSAWAGSIGPSLRWNILNYGRITNAIRVQDARFEQLAVVYQNSVLRANQEVENGLVAFLRGHERVKSLGESAGAAKTANDLYNTQDKEGRAIDYNRLFNLQDQVATQQDQLAAAQGDLAQSLIQTYRALGGGWEIRCAAPTPSSE